MSPFQKQKASRRQHLQNQNEKSSWFDTFVLVSSSGACFLVSRNASMGVPHIQSLKPFRVQGSSVCSLNFVWVSKKNVLYNRYSNIYTSRFIYTYMFMYIYICGAFAPLHETTFHEHVCLPKRLKLFGSLMVSTFFLSHPLTSLEKQTVEQKLYIPFSKIKPSRCFHRDVLSCPPFESRTQRMKMTRMVEDVIGSSFQLLKIPS